MTCTECTTEHWRNFGALELAPRLKPNQTGDIRPFARLTAALVTCEASVAEACYLLRDLRGAPEAVVSNVGSGVFKIPVRLVDQAANAEKLMKKYRDVPMDLADACLVDLADRLKTGRILTLDRDFELYRWRVRRKFDLVVAL